MNAFRSLYAVLLFALWGCGSPQVAVHVEPVMAEATATLSVYPPHMGQRIKIVEVDGVKMGGGGGLTVVRMAPGHHRISARVSIGSDWGSAARYDYVGLKADIVLGGDYHLEISPVTRVLQIKDVRTGQVVGQSRYRIL